MSNRALAFTADQLLQTLYILATEGTKRGGMLPAYVSRTEDRWKTSRKQYSLLPAEAEERKFSSIDS